MAASLPGDSEQASDTVRPVVQTAHAGNRQRVEGGIRQPGGGRGPGRGPMMCGPAWGTPARPSCASGVSSGEPSRFQTVRFFPGGQFLPLPETALCRTGSVLAAQTSPTRLYEVMPSRLRIMMGTRSDRKRISSSCRSCLATAWNIFLQ